MDRTNRNTSRVLTLIANVLIFLLFLALTVIAYDTVRSLKAVRNQLSETKECVALLQQEIEKIRGETEVLQLRTEELQKENESFTSGRDTFFSIAMELERRVQNNETDIKIAYLTFDDGPYEATTGRFLDVLDEYHIKATFFQLGKTTEIHDQLYHRIYESGHTIANHTYSHKIKNGIYRNVDTFIDDVVKNREFIEEKLGITTNILRFPGGSATAGNLKEGILARLRELGYGYVDWNAETLDGKYINLEPEEYRDNLFARVDEQKFLVVLMHDYCEGTLAALPEIIEGLKERGYIFLPLFYESVAVNK